MPPAALYPITLSFTRDPARLFVVLDRHGPKEHRVEMPGYWKSGRRFQPAPTLQNWRSGSRGRISARSRTVKRADTPSGNERRICGLECVRRSSLRSGLRARPREARENLPKRTSDLRIASFSAGGLCSTCQASLAEASLENRSPGTGL